jgi:hypothetical protein
MLSQLCPSRIIRCDGHIAVMLSQLCLSRIIRRDGHIAVTLSQLCPSCGFGGFEGRWSRFSSESCSFGRYLVAKLTGLLTE